MRWLELYVAQRDIFLSSFYVTFQICLASATGALLLGTVLAGFRVSPIPPLRWLGASYVTVVRNIPLTVVFFFVAFGLPEIRVTADFLRVPLLADLFPRLDTVYFRFAIVALTVYTAAFVCEGLRSGINSVQPGQSEAGRSLGLTFLQNLRLVVLPQARRVSIVPVGSVIIAMIKNSALAGAFGVVGDLFSTTEVLTSARGEPFIPVALGISVCFLVLTIPLGLLMDRIERRQAVTR